MKRSLCSTLLHGLLTLSLIVQPVQPQQPARSTAPAQTVADLTITMQREQVRFVTSRAVEEQQLQIFNQSGELIYDSGALRESEANWSLRDASDRRVESGLYQYKLTVKLSGSDSVQERRGHLIVNRASQEDRLWITAQSDDAIGTSIIGAELTVSAERERQVAGTRLAETVSLERGRAVAGRSVLTPAAEKGVEKTNGTESVLAGTPGKIAKFDVDGATVINSIMEETPGAGIGVGGAAITTLTVNSDSNPLPAGSGSLLIQGNSNKERIELRSAQNGGMFGGAGPIIQGKGFDGTIAAPLNSKTNMILGGFGGSGHDGTQIVTGNKGLFMVRAEEDWTTTAQGVFAVIETTQPGQTTRTEKLRVTGAGNVGIGTNAPTEKLQVAGVIHSTTGGIRFPDGSLQTTAGTISGVTSVTASGVLTSSGGITPNLSLTGVVPVANGGTGNSSAGSAGQFLKSDGMSFAPASITAADVSGVVDTSSTQTVGGAKTFSNSINTTTDYQINGARILSIAGTNNLFAGTNAGINNTTGFTNTFLGAGAGTSNTGGAANTFVGSAAGTTNTTGVVNTFVGYAAGANNTTGSSNTFTGGQAGSANTTGFSNSFYGFNAGKANTTGNNNTFFGNSAGLKNTTASENTFFGGNAGRENTTGAFNAFFGRSAGANNTTGTTNSFFGSTAGVSNTIGGSNSFFGSGAGSGNVDGNSNSFFGRDVGFNNTSGSGNSFFGHGAGNGNTTANDNSFFGVLAGEKNTTGGDNAFFGAIAGINTTTGSQNVLVGYATGADNTTGNLNTFIGSDAGNGNTIESENTFVGAITKTTPGITNATAIGARAQAAQSDSLVLGSIAGINGAATTVNVGIGTNTPTSRLHVVGDAIITGNLNFSGSLAGSGTNLTSLNASNITSGTLGVARGGTGADLSATGGAGQYLKQMTAGGAVTVGAIAATDIPAGSPDYIQNQNVGAQAGANFNISGDGTAGGTLSGNIVNATTQYNLNGSRILSAAGGGNLFAGLNAGISNTTGGNNAFFGNGAGQSNTTGGTNSFFGATAGLLNTTGESNSFFGSGAGINNIDGNSNSFFGRDVGFNNTSGGGNSFFGHNAGNGNTTANDNSFFGTFAGEKNNTGNNNAFFGFASGANNTNGGSNSFFGRSVGVNNTTGSGNTFVGLGAGLSNSTENNNTFIGVNSNGAAGINDATAIGAGATVTQSNSVVLGNNANVGIGESAPKARLDVRNGNIYLGTAGQGVILKSPDGMTCRLLTIDNSGALALNTIACP